MTLRHIVPERLVDPRCKGVCKGDRPAGEGPARMGHRPDGTKVLWCPCCETELRPEGPLDFSSGPPNVDLTKVKGTFRRYIDVLCGYDTVLLSEVQDR